MIFVSTIRTTRFAFQNFWRNFWLSIVNIIILVLTLIFVSLLSSLNLLADQAIRLISEKVETTVFFVTEASEDQILSAKSFLETFPEAKRVKYVSQTEAFLNFKEEHQDDEDILASLAELDENPFPASLIIQANQLDQYAAINEKLEQSTYKELIFSRDFEDSQVIIERIARASSMLTKIGIGVSVLFALISFLVAFNTFRIAIYSYREEIGIMKLVGATNWFIRTPFMIESFLYAFIASVITMLLLYPIAVVVAPFMNQFFDGYTFDFLAFLRLHVVEIFVIELVVALVLSAFSSMVAISRYLKV